MPLSEYPIKGKYKKFGGSYVPEILIPSLLKLEALYLKIKDDEGFKKNLHQYNLDYGGRPTPLYYAKRLSGQTGGAKIYLKREDLVHGGAHKFNNVMGQALLAKKLGKERIICETGAGQHGVATALAGAVLGIETEVYMGAVDAKRQESNLFRMQLMGAKVNMVESGSQTLKDAINEALRDWATNVDHTYYLIGSVVGPHPYPMIVRDFQRIIGDEIKTQIMKKEGKQPTWLIACVGGGSNAMGTFYPFVDDLEVEFLGVEAAGTGQGSGAASLVEGEVGILHGAKSYLLQDKWGQIKETESIAAGLDYPGVGPEHALLKETGRAKYITVSDQEALQGFKTLSVTEGIIPALESAHAVHAGTRIARKLSSEQIVVITVSGRGDKDLTTVRRYMNHEQDKK